MVIARFDYDLLLKKGDPVGEPFYRTCINVGTFNKSSIHV